MSKRPREIVVPVSLGLPVYNGEEFLETTLKCILGQTYGSFELIICDNASDDATHEICRWYETIDARVRYYRNPMNLGAAHNFNRTFRLARGRYFKWVTYDDLYEADFIGECVSVLEADSTVVLCQTDLDVIGSKANVIEGHPAGELHRRMTRVAAESSSERFEELTDVDHRCIDVLGLIRADALRKTSLIGGYVGSDRNLLVELGLIGRFHRIPKKLFCLRDHDRRSVRLTLSARAVWYDPRNRGTVVLPNWRRLVEYVRAVRRSDLGWLDRRRCLIQIARLIRRDAESLKSELWTGALAWVKERLPERESRRLRQLRGRVIGFARGVSR